MGAGIPLEQRDEQLDTEPPVSRWSWIQEYPLNR